MNPSGNHSSAKKTPASAENVSPASDANSSGAGKPHLRNVIPDEVADAIVAELREIENVAHE